MVQRAVPDWMRRLWWLLPLVAFVSVVLSGIVPNLGFYIPTSYPLEGHIQAVIVGAILGGTLLWWPSELWEKRTILIAWSVKLVVVLVAMLFYENIYNTLDAYSYYAGYLLAPDMPPTVSTHSIGLGAGTENVTAFTQALKSLGLSFHSIKLIFAYAGFASCWITYRAGVILTGKPSFFWLAVLTVSPSMLFWTGILGKDPIVVLGIAIYLYGCARYYRDHKLADLGWIGLGLLVATSVRFWMLLILAAPLVYLFAFLGPRNRRIVMTVVMAGVIGLATVVLAIRRDVTSPNDLVPMLAKVSQQWAEGGSAQKMEIPFDSLGGLILFLPLGAFTALFRPLPLEVPNAFGLLAGFENMALLLITFYVLLRKGLSVFRDPRMLFLLLCLVSWSLLYALISYQNLGTASRFKVQALPFLFLLYWCALHARRVTQVTKT